MKKITIFVALSLACVMGAAFAAAPKPPKERLAKSIELQAFFHTPQPWRVDIFQPEDTSDWVGNWPVRVCLIGPPDTRGSHSHYTSCTALYGDKPLSSGKMPPLQTLDSAGLEELPGPGRATSRPALVIRATFNGGGPGQIHDVRIWNYLPDIGGFMPTFKSETSQAGQQEFVKTGPLAGAFVKVDQVYEGNEANMISPVRYEMEIYEPTPLGYTRVLTFLSEKRHPSNHAGGGIPNPIATLTPIMVKALKAVYPNGVLALEQ